MLILNCTAQLDLLVAYLRNNKHTVILDCQYTGEFMHELKFCNTGVYIIQDDMRMKTIVGWHRDEETTPLNINGISIYEDLRKASYAVAKDSSTPSIKLIVEDEPITPVEKDMVNHPPHYNQGSVECIDAIASALGKELFIGYLRGQVIKYTWRLGHKTNDLEDAKKAAWYQNKLIEVMGEEK